MTGGGFPSRPGINVCWLFSFFVIHSDYFQHMEVYFLERKQLVKALTLISFRLVQ